MRFSSQAAHDLCFLFFVKSAEKIIMAFYLFFIDREKNTFRPNENPTQYSLFQSSTVYTKFDLTNKEASTALCSVVKHA